MSSKKDNAKPTNSAPPQHIAIIMDGNGRWAKSKGLPRSSGHQKGVQAVRKIVKHSAMLGVNTLTLFAFSSENMKRPNEEVGLLFKLFLSVLKTETKKLKANNIKLRIIGDLSDRERVLIGLDLLFEELSDEVLAESFADEDVVGDLV